MVKGDDGYTQRKMKQAIKKATYFAQIVQTHEEPRPDSRLNYVRDTDNQEANDGQPGDCNLHNFSLSYTSFLGVSVTCKICSPRLIVILYVAGFSNSSPSFVMVHSAAGLSLTLTITSSFCRPLSAAGEFSSMSVTRTME